MYILFNFLQASVSSEFIIKSQYDRPLFKIEFRLLEIRLGLIAFRLYLIPLNLTFSCEVCVIPEKLCQNHGCWFPGSMMRHIIHQPWSWKSKIGWSLLTHLPLVRLVACSVPSHYPNQCWLIVNWTLRNKLQWNSNRKTKLFIHENAFVKMSSAKWRPFCPGEDGLTSMRKDVNYVCHYSVEEWSQM